MLAGLLFAIEEASAPAGGLVATLPFAGSTLIEHQARQLVAAGAAQIVVIGEAFEGELRGALHRIGRRGLTVDAVHGVGEAARKLHPLARVVMLADGLVAADATIAAMADDGEAGDALLVVAGAEAPATFERIGGGEAWAGIARLDPQRLHDAGALPVDYAPQSTLLHVAEAAGAARLGLPGKTLAEGHGIERDARAIERRGRRLVAAALAMRDGWFDRIIAAPFARATMPRLLASDLSAVAALAIVGVAALLALIALLVGWPRVGLCLALLATLACPLIHSLATLRDEPALATAARTGALAIPAAAVLSLGIALLAATGSATPLVLALTLVVATGLSIRAGGRPRPWWGSPPAYLLLVAIGTIAGSQAAALAIAGCYAGATLAAAIEAIRPARRA